MASAPPALLDAIRRALEPRLDVEAALLFGSHATGAARPDSDIDVAILLRATPSSSERKDVLMSLIGALAQHVACDRLDIVLLNDAPTKLAFSVLRDGVVAFERDPVALHRFRVATYRHHSDFEPVEKMFREATKRRVLAEASRG